MKEMPRPSRQPTCGQGLGGLGDAGSPRASPHLSKTLSCCSLSLAAAAAQAGDSPAGGADERCLEITQIQSKVSLPCPGPGTMDIWPGIIL